MALLLLRGDKSEVEVNKRPTIRALVVTVLTAIIVKTKERCNQEITSTTNSLAREQLAQQWAINS